MTTGIPEKIPLDLPPGDPEAVEELVRAVAGAAFCLAVLGGDLSGPAAAAPGWLGDDATAAARQIGLVADLVRDASGAVLTATARLSAHSRCLREARSQVTALRAEQDEEHRAAWSRLSAVVDIGTPGQSALLAAAAIGEEFAASEASRGRRHAALLAEVADDAAATARVLAESTALVGGTGRPGDDGRSVAHLAVLLPGWGDEELAARGSALAVALVGGPVSPEEMNDLARAAEAYAGMKGFANALLTGLGEEGVRHLLTGLGLDALGPDPAVARLLSSALGAAVPEAGDRDPVGAVLGGTYTTAPDADAAAIVAGMAAVLAAGASSPTGGLRAVTVAAWAREMLLRERAPDSLGSMAPITYDRAGALSDPAALAIGVLAERGNSKAAAVLLADRDVWQVLLTRSWVDGGAALGVVVEQAGRHVGASGAQAVRSGLEVIGAGLTPGDPSDWTVSRDMVAAVSPALARAVAAQVPVAVEALSVGIDGRLGDREDALRGLGYLTLHRNGADAVERALVDWAQGQSAGPEGAGPLSPLPAVAVPAAYVAAQEYGQRLAHSLHAFEQQEDAENKQLLWDHTVGLVGFLPGWWGVGAGLVEGYAAIALGMDGTYEVGADRGLHFDSGDAADLVAEGLPTERAVDTAVVVAQARAAYDRAMRALGAIPVPESPEHDFLEPFVDFAGGAAAERIRKSPLGPR
jgi:hypothetical protein